MQTYQTGSIVCAPSPDMVIFDLADDCATLLIKINRPTAKERSAFSEPFPFRFVVADDIIMVLFQLAGTWMDAPYYKGRSRELTELPSVHPGEGLAVHAMLIDASTGLLVDQKLFSLSTGMTVRLFEAVAAQPVIPAYEKRVAELYKKYSTADLVKISEE